MTVSDLPPVFDGHNDTLLSLALPERGGGRSFFERSETGHVDLPRAREGNLGGGVFATFVTNQEDLELHETDEGYEVPLSSPVEYERARAMTDDLLSDLQALEAESNGDLRIARSADELRETFESDALAAVAHLEGAAAVAPDLSNLDDLYEQGVRSIGLVWSRPNDFGHGVPFRFPASPDIGPGLTDAGRNLVEACNERGILVDCAHLNAAGFWDVAEISTAPLVVSHGGVHEVSPATRNLTDDQIDAIADSGGLVGITFAAAQLRPDGADEPDIPLSFLADHITYVADRVGVEHVAFGSDFDGATILESVGDVAGLPDVLRELRDRGFSDSDLRKVAHENWLRVFEATIE